MQRIETGICSRRRNESLIERQNAGEWRQDIRRELAAAILVGDSLRRLLQRLGLEFVAHENVGGDFEHGLAAEKIEQDGDAVAGGHDLGDDGLKPVKSTAGKLDAITRREAGLNDVQFVVAKAGAKVIDGFIGHGGPFVTEVDDVLDAGGVVNASERPPPIEPGEEIIGKKGFGDERRAVRRGTGKADARAEDLHVLDLREMARGELLVLLLRANAKPRHVIWHHGIELRGPHQLLFGHGENYEDAARG